MASDRQWRVLLIEDNPGDARLMREYLAADRGAGFQIDWADRLAKGLALLSQSPFDAVILDLTLPDSKGLETFQRVHEGAPQVAILVLSGLDDEALAVEAVQLGAQDYIVKGQVGGARLVRAIRYAIERQRASAGRGSAVRPDS